MPIRLYSGKVYIYPTKGCHRKGTNRVNRGGSWNNDAQNCRVSYRNHNSPENRDNNLGFRLALPFQLTRKAGWRPLTR